MRTSPVATVASVRHKLREVDARMQKMERYVTSPGFNLDKEFRDLRELGLSKGFMEVVAGPLVRSSYRADRVFDRNNAGM